MHRMTWGLVVACLRRHRVVQKRNRFPEAFFPGKHDVLVLDRQPAIITRHAIFMSLPSIELGLGGGGNLHRRGFF